MTPLRTRSRKPAAPAHALRRRLEALEDRAVPAAVAPPPGLVSWWTGDNTAADVTGRNDGTLMNGATFVTGVVGQAFQFDGVNDRVQITDSASLRLTNSLSIEGWIRVNALPTNAGNVLHRGDTRSGLDPYKLQMMPSGTLRFAVSSEGDGVASLESPVPLGQFIHVAATLDDATGVMTLYVDGTVVAQTTTALRPFGDLDPSLYPGVGIGNTESPLDFPFNGLIDELAVYDRALTAEEVQGIFGAGGDGKVLNRATKFYVVDDATTNCTFEYANAGVSAESYSLSGGNAAPRGAASTLAGDKLWVVDANRTVFVYSAAGALLGSWSAGSLNASAQVEGIATNGTDVWLLDAKQDKVFRYAGAASRLSGSQNATSSFALNKSNANGKGIVTDGTSFWVVDDAATDKVFKYTLAGALLGSWAIDAANASPTGLTIDPANVSDIWVVDNGTDRVYQYAAAAGRTSGSQSASATFALAAGNTNPQDIADPPPAALLLAPRAAMAPAPAAGDGVTPVLPAAAPGVNARRAGPPRVDLGAPSVRIADPVLHGTRVDAPAERRWLIDLTPSDDGWRSRLGRLTAGHGVPVSAEFPPTAAPVEPDDAADLGRITL